MSCVLLILVRVVVRFLVNALGRLYPLSFPFSLNLCPALLEKVMKPIFGRIVEWVTGCLLFPCLYHLSRMRLHLVASMLWVTREFSIYFLGSLLGHMGTLHLFISSTACFIVPPLTPCFSSPSRKLKF